MTFSGTTEGGDAACDKTALEVIDADIAGKDIKVQYKDDSNTIYQLAKSIHYNTFYIGGSGIISVNSGYGRTTAIYCKIDGASITVEMVTVVVGNK